jgi:glycosyltransferase involved in cell wall biosynthesis
VSAIERIGLNLLFMLPDRGGRETASRELIGAMREREPELEMVAYTGAATASMLRTSESWASAIRFREARFGQGRTSARIGTELSWLPTQARRDRVQLLHSLGNTAPAWNAVPSVVTIHDLHYHHFPEIQGLQTRLGLQILVPAVARRARRIICPSEATKSDVVEVLSVDPDRVDVIPHGPGRSVAAAIDEDQLRSRFGLGTAPLVLCPAVGFKYKNLSRLLDAFADVAARSDAILVHTGWLAREGAALRRQAELLGISERVRFLGWVGESTLESLYAAAQLLVSPSIAEGFGFPVLEAMRRGLPVACSNVSALAEVAGEAAELFDPFSAGSIEAAIMRLLEDPGRRRELVARGEVRASEFTWETAAQRTLETYERALQDDRGASSRTGSWVALGSKPATTRSRRPR